MSVIRYLKSLYLPLYKKYIKPNFIYYIEALLTASLMSVVGVIPPFITRIIFDDALIGQDLSLFIILSFILNGVNLIFAAINMLRDYIFELLVMKVDTKAEIDYMYHFIKLPFKFYNKKRVGEIIMRISDSSVIHGMMNIMLFDVINNFVTVVIYTIACLLINPLLTLSVFLFFPFYIFYSLKVATITRIFEEENWERGQVLNSEQFELFSGIRVIKAFASESRVFRKLKHFILKFRNFNLKYQRVLLVWEFLFSFVNTVESFVTFLIAGIFMINGKMTIGEWIAFQAVAANLFGPLKELLPVNRNIQNSILALERINEINSITEESYTKKKDAVIDKGKVIFDDVTFSYLPDEPVIHNLSIELKAGKSHALVGRSGAGKSTISNLLMKFYLPDSGRIIIDGIDLTEFDVKSLRSNIGIVLQDNYLFHGTVLDNLKMVSPFATEDQIVSACKKAYVDEFIRAFPDGYDTKVGEMGVRLSGGQKQRLNIAQAILKDPAILILDEATSHLDLETEEKVQDALKFLMNDRTSLVIAHRLSTIESADTIFVMDKGRLIESGNHDGLMGLNGFYHKLYMRTATL